MADEIDRSHVFPCDFVVGHIRFSKGVALETVRQAAMRWHADVQATHVDGAKLRGALQEIGRLGDVNCDEGPSIARRAIED